MGKVYKASCSVIRDVSNVLLLGLLLLGAGNLSCFLVPGLSDGHVRVLVHMGSGPVEEARVQVWSLDDEGRLAGAEEGAAAADIPPLAEGYTDRYGRVTLDLGAPQGTLMIVATGGTTRDSWGEEASERSFRIPEDLALRVVLTDFVPYDQVYYDVTVSPFTTIATTLAEQWIARGDRRYAETMSRAYALLGGHLGDIDIVQGHPMRIDQDATLTRDERHYLMLAALRSLARSIADASGISARGIGTLDLVQGLIADASDIQGLLDGVGPLGALSVGTCSRPPACQPGDRSGECNTLCDLDANTLRADLAQALAADVLSPAFDKAELSFEDVRMLVDALASAEIPEIFGAAPNDSVEHPRPLIEVGRTTMEDESRDRVTFTERAVPVHEPSGDMIELGEEGVCPTVYKHAHRLADASDNPVRWTFTVRDRSGAGVGTGEYRVRLRSTPQGVWLTDWLPATALASVDDGIQYEVVLTRMEVPELSTVQGIFEIELRGIDRIATMSTPVQRCWRQVPLAAPLDVGETNEAFGAGSLHAAGLESGRMPLAPIINGVPLDQGLALMELSLRNGTDVPVYLALHYEQPEAIATRDWILTSAMLYTFTTQDAACLLQGTCPREWPPRLATADPDSVTVAIPELIGGVQVWDVTAGVPLELLPCSECTAKEFLIPPRRDAAHPRQIQIRVVSTHIAEIAPAAPGFEETEVYEDVPMEPEFLPRVITGRRYERDDTLLCKRTDIMTNSVCIEKVAHVRYRALGAASISAGEILVTGETRSSVTLPLRTPTGHDGTFGSIDAFTWTSVEEPFPTPHPNENEKELP